MGLQWEIWSVWTSMLAIVSYVCIAEKTWKHSPVHELDAINSYVWCFCFDRSEHSENKAKQNTIVASMPKHKLIEKPSQHTGEREEKTKRKQKWAEEEDESEASGHDIETRMKSEKAAQQTHGPNFFSLSAMLPVVVSSVPRINFVFIHYSSHSFTCAALASTLICTNVQ